MMRRLRIPLLAVVFLLTLTAQAPAWWPRVRAAFDGWSALTLAVAWTRFQDITATLMSRGASVLGWSATAFTAAAAVTIVALAAFALVIAIPVRRHRASKETTGNDRRDKVAKMARAGRPIALIARETRLGQDAVRSLLAAR